MAADIQTSHEIPFECDPRKNNIYSLNGLTITLKRNGEVLLAC